MKNWNWKVQEKVLRKALQEKKIGQLNHAREKRGSNNVWVDYGKTFYKENDEVKAYYDKLMTGC